MSRSAARIVDANINRCREGLRALEEYARFVLADRGSAAAVKSLRHELKAAADGYFVDADLISARESAGDVLAADPSVARADEREVACAAASRAAEALRSIEEYGGILNPEAPAGFARLRFRLYSLQKEILAGDVLRKGRLAGARLYVLLTERFCANGDVLETARQAISGGADMLQYREKEMEDGAFLAAARALAAICAQSGTLLVINDRPHIARLCGADGVHLGQGDLTAADAREILGPGRIIGRSTHNPQQAAEAAAEGADYIGVGPVFETRTKEHRSSVGTDYVSHCSRSVDIPAFAIGSVNLDTIEQVMAAGAGRVAVCTGITMQEDVAAAARAFRLKLDGTSLKED